MSTCTLPLLFALALVTTALAAPEPSSGRSDPSAPSTRTSAYAPPKPASEASSTRAGATGPQAASAAQAVPTAPATIVARVIEAPEQHNTLKEWLDSLLTIATIILAAVTTFLWLSTRKLAADAEAAGVRQNRAYVFVVDFQFRTILDNPTSHPHNSVSRLEMSCKFTNSGNTPAIEVKAQIRARVVPKNADGTPGVPEGIGAMDVANNAMGILPPKVSVTSADTYVMPADVARCIHGEADIFIVARCEYRDTMTTEKHYHETIVKWLPHQNPLTDWKTATADFRIYGADKAG